MAALRAGSVQLTWLSRPNSAAQMRDVADIVAPEPETYSRLMLLEFDQRKPPFNDVRVRRAFSLALNRELIVKVVWRRTGRPRGRAAADASAFRGPERRGARLALCQRRCGRGQGADGGGRLCRRFRHDVCRLASQLWRRSDRPDHPADGRPCRHQDQDPAEGMEQSRRRFSIDGISDLDGRSGLGARSQTTSIRACTYVPRSDPGKTAIRAGCDLAARLARATTWPKRVSHYRAVLEQRVADGLRITPCRRAAMGDVVDESCRAAPGARDRRCASIFGRPGRDRRKRRTRMEVSMLR